MDDTVTLNKLKAFKAAIINEFDCNTFEEFVTALRDRMNHLSTTAGTVMIYGHDIDNNRFRFYVESFDFRPLNDFISLTVNYQWWEHSSGNSSGWRKEVFVMHRQTYKCYKRDANRIYKKNKPHDDALDALRYTCLGGRNTWNSFAAMAAPKIKEAILKKFNDENDISIGDFGGTIKDYITFECSGMKFEGYIKSISCVDPSQHAGAVTLYFHDVVFIVEDKPNRIEVCIPCFTRTCRNYHVRYDGLGNIVGIHVSDDEREWDYYNSRRKPGVTYQHVSTAKPGSTETQKVIEKLLKNSFYGMNAISPLDGKPHVEPVSYSQADVECCMDYYNYLDEKENKEMKNEHKIIINHNAVIAIDGKYKSVVKLREGEKWNTKLGVVMVVAKFTRRDLYKLLRTIKNPGNETIDHIADLIQMGSGNGGIRAFKWYQDAIKVKRPVAGKQVSIDITYEEA